MGEKIGLSIGAALMRGTYDSKDDISKEFDEMLAK